MLTPEGKLRQLIVYMATGSTLDVNTTEEVDEAYLALSDDELSENKENLRCGGIPTGIYNPDCRGHKCYDDEQVAVQALDGSWVGFTYWSGGGKHGYPEDVEWMDDAYELDAFQVMEPVWKFKQKEKNEQS